MSIGQRIKERRKYLNMSRTELANKINVSVSAISNYENELSTPTIDNICHLINALDCDANFLFQDEMRNVDSFEMLSLEEQEYIKKYRSLSDFSKKAVILMLQNEYDRDHPEETSITIDIKKDDDSSKNIYSDS